MFCSSKLTRRSAHEFFRDVQHIFNIETTDRLMPKTAEVIKHSGINVTKIERSYSNSFQLKQIPILFLPREIQSYLI